MDRVANLEHYYALINEAKSEYGRLSTNNLLFPDAIERYLDLGRFYYEKVTGGVIFFSDEEDFYEALYHISAKEECRFSKKEKPVLIQCMYTNGKKRPDMQAIGRMLESSGFVLAQTLRQGVFEETERIAKVRRSLRGVMKVFDREGFRMMPVSAGQLSEMKAFRKTIKEIPFYQFPYFTDEELVCEADAGRLLCITDKNGRMIAARHLIVNGKKAYGWVGVEEQYKGTYGLALVFLNHALDYVEREGIKMCSWVDDVNIPSLQYHEHIGTVWTGQAAEEWVLESR